MNNTTTLSQVVKDLYTANTNISVKDLLGEIQSHHSHLKDKAHYRAVYNTLKRVSKGSVKAPKASSTEKASIILDLTQPPINSTAIPGKVYCRGRK